MGEDRREFDWVGELINRRKHVLNPIEVVGVVEPFVDATDCPVYLYRYVEGRAFQRSRRYASSS